MKWLVFSHKKLNHTLEDASIMKLTADNEFISVMDLKAHELNRTKTLKLVREESESKVPTYNCIWYHDQQHDHSHPPKCICRVTIKV